MQRVLCRWTAYSLAANVMFLAACAPSVVGFYVNERKPQNTTELRADGTFLVTERSESFAGKYHLKGKTLILELPNGHTVSGSLEGNVMIDADGEKLIKSPGYP